MSGHAMVSFIKRIRNLQNIALFTALCIAVVIAAASLTPRADNLAPQGAGKLFLHRRLCRTGDAFADGASEKHPADRTAGAGFWRRYRTNPSLYKPVWRFLSFLGRFYECYNWHFFGNTLTPLYKAMREA